MDQCELIKSKHQLESRFLDAVVCVAGERSDGNTASENFISGFDVVLDAIERKIWSSRISSLIASNYLKPEGLLVLSGAAASAFLAAEKMGLPENSWIKKQKQREKGP